MRSPASRTRETRRERLRLGWARISAPSAGLALIAVLAFVAGCGGGGKALTKDEYTKKLGRLCLVSDDQVRELHMDLTVADWKAFGDKVVAIDKKFLDGMDALEPPSEINDLVSRYREKVQAATDDTNAGFAAAKKGDLAGLKASLAKADKDYQESWPIAKEMGAKGCYFG